jgi:Sulfotransferase domain
MGGSGGKIMALEVIGAGFSRTATFSLKFALEHLGFGPCHHFSDIFAGGPRKIAQWLDVVAGRPDWDGVFDGFLATVDTPACNYWRELADYYPDAKVVLTVRDADSWFDSASETIFSDRLQGSLIGSPMGVLMRAAILDVSGGPITDRAFMTDWYRRRNQEVIDALPPKRLLVFSPEDGWAPLCAFLQVPVPECRFPRVNSRDELTQVSDENAGLPADPEVGMRVAREYIDRLKVRAFAD